MTLEQLARQGRRTSSMTTASTITSKISQIRKESIRQAFCDFENIKYRYEFVDAIENVNYYDDSGACSCEATWFSFDNIGESVVWITYADNFDCDELVPQVKKYVKSIICIGNNTDRFHNVFGNIIEGEIIDCQSIEEAVKLSYGTAEPGDNVLFSPSTPVKGDFMSYAQRGDFFKQCVNSLK
jgi:UDP-N-acetylmuramoylalanine--D-glutamate ligase